ncbi:NAD-dependent epimerase/dehydratase family protein [Longirhabdus pacifica]|uniref:NAD-dependent epimerase/dehydratase family protein n=1 Tax=Longirhabdus pacifica TaxID=2305227 RepID=UPI0013E8D294|nr:NAD-dependent epimerase/dehydratase family protein [Longirhabdus pacifica]
MKLLVIGGTVFVGYHIVDAALKAGHEVTLFNRGQSNVDAFPEVETLIGDRHTDLSALKGRKWDAVIDTPGYIPKSVTHTAQCLQDAVDVYAFMSTVSVYQDYLYPNKKEDEPLLELEDPTSEDVRQYYGELKVLSERAIESVMPNRGIYFRPGLIVGPRDPMDRFTYWPTRVHKGGKVLVPGQPDDFVQFIDVRDLAAFVIHTIEQKHTGAYNCMGPEHPISFLHFLNECKKITNSDAQFVWMDHEFLLDRKVMPWDELPLWNPKQGETAHMTHYMEVSNEKAKAKGLTLRPISETIRDTWEWDMTRPTDQMRFAGLKDTKEQKLLQEWLQHHG